MNCVTCNANIPPAFVHAIQMNICPGCAGPIMTEASKLLMDELKTAMISMPNDPEGLAGWLLSTYDLFPKGEVSPTNFHRKNSRQEGDNSVLKMANTATNTFMKRSGADKIKKNPKLAAIEALQREAGGYLQQEEPEEEIEGLDEEAQEDVENEEAEMLKMIMKAKQKGKKLSTAQLLSNSSDFGNDFGNDSEISFKDKQKIQQMIGGGQDEFDNPEDREWDDVQYLPPALQADKIKRLEKQREMGFGSIGMIKRQS